MKFGYTIIYVADVIATIEFYETAFGLGRRFIHESHQYAELETGATVLAFASDAAADINNLAIRPNRKAELAAGFEVAFVCDDPAAAYDTALAAGASPVSAPSLKPWGQTVSYVRDLNGCLVEICSPISPSP